MKILIEVDVASVLGYDGELTCTLYERWFKLLKEKRFEKRFGRVPVRMSGDLIIEKMGPVEVDRHGNYRETLIKCVLDGVMEEL